MIFYDHIITLADEMDYIWYAKHGFNGASYIFLANRLAAMVYGVGLLAQIFNWDTRVVRLEQNLTEEDLHYPKGMHDSLLLVLRGQHRPVSDSNG